MRVALPAVGRLDVATVRATPTPIAGRSRGRESNYTTLSRSLKAGLCDVRRPRRAKPPGPMAEAKANTAATVEPTVYLGSHSYDGAGAQPGRMGPYETAAAAAADTTRRHSDGDRRHVDSDRRSRRAFAALDYKLCYACGREGLVTRRVAAASRCPGGEYGTQFFDCSFCTWSTSFLYDEQADQFFYETRHWNLQSIEDFPCHYALEWLRREGFAADVLDAVSRHNLGGDAILRFKNDGRLGLKLDIADTAAELLSCTIPAPMSTSAA